jgi:hypothetical protein
MMKKKQHETLDEIRKILEENKTLLQTKFKIREIGIFGSYVRGEQKKKSDVDILVEFSETISFFDFIEIERELGKLIGLKVDLVMKSALKPRIGQRILQEVQYI